MNFDEGKLYFIDGIAPSGDGENFVARLLSQKRSRQERFLYLRLTPEQVHCDLVEYYRREGIPEYIFGSKDGLHDGMFIRLGAEYNEKALSFSNAMFLKKGGYKKEERTTDALSYIIEQGVRDNMEMYEKKQSCDPRLYCFDVGQGDMSVFISSEGRIYIIDTHIYSRNVNQKTALLESIIGDRPVEALILTHRHWDHYLGADRLLDQFKIKNLIVNSSFANGDQPVQVERLFDKALKNKTKIITPLKSYDFSDGDTHFKFEMPNVSNASENKNSIILNITYKDKLYCLTGDADAQDLEKIIYEKCNDVFLKVSHHGSITGTSLPFLNKFDGCKTKKAFISVGQKNRYHHPNALCGFWLNGKNFDVAASTIIKKYQPY